MLQSGFTIDASDKRIWGQYMKHVFNVQGMTCQHCEQAVLKALKRLDEQAQVHIDRVTGCVEVDSTQASKKLSDAIEEEGYTVVP